MIDVTVNVIVNGSLHKRYMDSIKMIGTGYIINFFALVIAVQLVSPFLRILVRHSLNPSFST